jgi:hypothetical protein
VAVSKFAKGAVALRANADGSLTPAALDVVRSAVAGQAFKTINGESIVGTGNIAVSAPSGGGSGGGSGETVVDGGTF